MAHWIIEDRGFGGQFYQCSECRESWCDIFHDVSMEDNCPNCGAQIDEDATEYVEEITKRIGGRIKGEKHMKNYILFTAEELDDMIHGEEIRH